MSLVVVSHSVTVDAVRTLNTLQTNASYLEQVKRQRGDPQKQLEAMELFLARSGLQVEDLDRLNIIHVTGTKGKGSTCAFTECILRNYGLKTGFFSSPHLVQVRERIRINGQPIRPELFTKHFWRLYRRLEETKDGSCVSMPAYFRFLTLMAFHVFLQEKVRSVPTPDPSPEALGMAASEGWGSCPLVAPGYPSPAMQCGFLQVDLAVVEVGIGGAYDCTNIIRKPVVCGVSSLGIDHTSLLGDTVEKIAWQKGGIFKPGVPAFTVLQPEGPLAVLRERAQQISCPLYLCPPLEALEEGGPTLTLGLEGEHQRSNAALALQLAHCWLQQQGHQDLGELKMSRPSVPCQLPLAPVFQPTSHMRHGLQDTEWPGRTQVLQHGPLTWYLDGAHTTSSMQACVRWFRQVLQCNQRPPSGPEVRVLLFNSTGDRDSSALLKLLQPCQFDYAVFCPNLTEVSSTGNADQQNFTVTLDQMLIRCLDHQRHWSHLDKEQDGPDLWGPPQPSRPAPLLLAPHPPHPCIASSLVFSCVSHALQWISQGRDPVFQPPHPPKSLLSHPTATSGASVLQEAAAIHVLVTGSRLWISQGRDPVFQPPHPPKSLLSHPTATSGASVLQEAAAIHVLVTGSLHLVGSVLKLLEPSLSQ
ncbi:Folylpolyglutamate synthase, mitochondrial [Heterocephalus glaber]|uniref:Folylpolyglutamate synthase, mitochondrial n=1 Tax=Heterocephalus glaber TaxID=10181 RepID=G5BLG3_HETGA|nr:Folylpolyglutamate synthase, mitochondrial [Heterocephalus glaber]